MNVQSVRVSKSVSKKEANEIVRKLGYKVSGVKPNPQYVNYHSYRQIQPKEFFRQSFRMKIIKSNPKVFLVVGKLKKK